jgi:hypothetical protein
MCSLGRSDSRGGAEYRDRNPLMSAGDRIVSQPAREGADNAELSSLPDAISMTSQRGSKRASARCELMKPAPSEIRMVRPAARNDSM